MNMFVVDTRNEVMGSFVIQSYEQALKRQKKDGIPIERAFEIEVEEMNIFLTKLDEKYYDELRPQHSVVEAMDKLVEWTASQPKSGG